MMAGTVVLSSCGNKGEEYSYSPEKAHEFIEKDYKSAFIQKYGEISPFETWDLSQRGSQQSRFLTDSRRRQMVYRFLRQKESRFEQCI